MIGGALTCPAVFAWEKHQTIMPFVLADAPSAAGPKPYTAAIMERIPAPCASDDQRIYKSLIGPLKLNPQSSVPPTAATACQNKSRTSAYEMLLGSIVDDPDHGMDQDLDPTPGNPYDPENDRAWMGGYAGATSKGFRHMYFGGWSLKHPISTFQIPLHAVGQSPDRVQLLATEARKLIRDPETRLWGYRVLGWAMHYVQDLAQPFHTVQLPSLRMVPWSSLWKWPPSAGFKDLVAETTRTIANYHWAYETLILKELEKGENSRLAECLSNPSESAGILKDPNYDADFPRSLALDVADESVGLAPEVGRGLIALFGDAPKKPGADFVRDPKGPLAPNYDMVMMDPDLNDARRELYATTCKALSNAVLGSRQLLAWAQKQ